MCKEQLLIEHDKDQHRAWTVIDGLTSYVEYDIHDGFLDIIHTIVPKKLEGQGIASMLVKFVYDYANEEGLKPAATCSYAVVWLRRHSRN